MTRRAGAALPTRDYLHTRSGGRHRLQATSNHDHRFPSSPARAGCGCLRVNEREAKLMRLAQFDDGRGARECRRSWAPNPRGLLGAGKRCYRARARLEGGADDVHRGRVERIGLLAGAFVRRVGHKEWHPKRPQARDLVPTSKAASSTYLFQITQEILERAKGFEPSTPTLARLRRAFSSGLLDPNHACLSPLNQSDRAYRGLPGLGSLFPPSASGSLPVKFCGKPHEG